MTYMAHIIFLPESGAHYGGLELYVLSDRLRLALPWGPPNSGCVVSDQLVPINHIS